MVPKLIRVRQGLCLRACQSEKFKAETVSVSTAFPLERDRYLTSLLLAVLGRGCQKYPTLAEISRRLDYLWGAELSFRDYTLGDVHVVGLYADLVSADYLPAGGETILREVLELLREILFHPLLDENGLLDAHYVESEKRLQCDAIRAKKNSPRAYALERCNALLFEGTLREQGALGTVEQVEAVTPELLTAHWHRLIDRIDLSCFYLGRKSGEEVAGVIDGVLGDLTAALPPLAARAYLAPPPLRAMRRAEDALPVTQGQLVLGLRFAAPLNGRRTFAAAYLHELLGASPVSKLFVNVRERLGLCYSCHALLSRYTATLCVSCGLDEENRDCAEREILAQINALSHGEITDTEWEAARTALFDHTRQMEDSPSAIDRFYFNCAVSGVVCSTEEWQESLDAVTREEVARLAGEMTVDTVFFLHPTRAGEEEEDEDEEN